MRILISAFLMIAMCHAAIAHDRIYRLKKGDTLEIWVEQDPNLRRQVVVAPDGRIALPLAGHLRAAGLTPEALERALAARLQKNFTTDVDVTVILANAAEPEEQGIIYVTGEVANPGSFTVTTPTTVLQAIALSGGLSEFAAKRRVHVRRTAKGRQVLIPFDYRNVETGRDMSDNVLLKDGDVVVVPERGLFE
jgi:polysaccharide export outer membrane protein